MSLSPESLKSLADLHKQIALNHAEIAAIYSEQAKAGAAKPPKKTAPAKKVSAAALRSTPAKVKAKTSVKVDKAPAPDDGKPPPIRVTVAGIDMAKLGHTKGESAVDWIRLVGHPPFQMFVSEQGFPNPEGKDGMELAVDFIKAQSEVKAEMAFYAEYAKWFKDKGYWPGETPMGQPIEKG